MKKLMRILLFLTGVLGAALCPAQIANQVFDDTDIFLNNPTIPPGLPNVLIIWDNTANWGQTVAGTTAYDLEKTALSTVISNLQLGPAGQALFNVGLMLFTETGGGNSNIRGSYPRYHLRPMDATNKAALSKLIDGLATIGDRGSNAQYAKAIHEARLYFGGQTALAGSGQVKRDAAAFVNGLKGTQYVSPIGDGCQKNFIILISNGGTDNGENKEAEGLLTGLGGKLKTDPIPLTPSGEQANWADEYSRFVANNDIHPTLALTQTAVVYTIAVFDPANCVSPFTANTQACNQIALAKSMANQGKGKYFAGTDLSSFQNALNQIFTEVQAVNSVFASVTLPVSVNPTTRGTNLNQVYMGLFRPDANLAPRWLGNLKLYQLARDANTQALFLADATGQPAVDSGTTGFLGASATSYWTTTSNFWAFSPSGSGGASDSPDGDLVEKGAVAQGLRTTYATSQAARTLYTCTGTCPSTSQTLTLFNTANTDITQGLLGAADGTERDAIINWVRGQDNISDENVNASLTDVRASIHGDVLHSRPAVINYNRNGDDNDVFVFYGSNDGIFRAVKGGFASAGGAPAPGAEAWGFVMPEHFGQLKRLRNNAPQISATPAANKRPYFADGPISAYIEDTNTDNILTPGTDKVYLYVGMRRGGRFIYALNVSNPLAPTLLWKKSNADFPELGFTFSEPKVARLKNRPNPVLIMGLGYDPNNQDLNVPVVNGDAMGRGIIILDAFTGALVWQAGPAATITAGAPDSVHVAGMTASISSDVSVLDRDGDGFIDRAYVGDNAGNVWRIDLVDGATPKTWIVNQLAAVGGTLADARKFQFPPDVVLSPDSSGGIYDAVLIGSGDREHPFDTTVTNRFYLFKDINVGVGSLTTSLSVTAISDSNAATDLFDATDNAIQTGTPGEQTAAQKALQSKPGWRLTLLPGEKVIGSSVTLGGATFFNTNQPSSSAPANCNANLGIAREYAVNYENAGAIIDFDSSSTLTTSDRFKTNLAGGYLPSPIPGIISVGGGSPELFVLSGPSLTKPPSTPVGSRFRTYWYLQTDM